ncbi:signal peptide peptidase-like 3 isoform X2 [Cottoperca gobio]|uniref:Signal peptide peptidase-like 3 isoform X2 n=1 Tax=Cottoperca gobio TaxID=56716 RepID=A0A6J2QU60_COTGO|nr:signal peptide peptidase-like 3 isoform X2 [Cottoperca gobio]
MAEQGYSSWAYSLVDSSQVSTFLISILLIVYGSFRSLNMDCENQEKDKDGNPTGFNSNTNNSIQTIDSTQALFLPIGASVSLLVMFFFFDSVQVVFTICTAVLATIAFAFLLLPMCQYLTRPCSPQNKISFGCCGRFTLAELLSFSLSVLLVLIWVLTGHWLLMDALAMGLCVAMIAFVRLPSLKVSCLLLSGLLIYDVFWVFFSAYIFNSNVMVKVATQPAENPIDVLSRKLHLGPGMGRDVPRLSLPGKLVFPSSTGSHFSMLGIGDIVMPGLLLCFVLRYDNYKKQANGEVPISGRMQRVSYFHCTLIGYFVGKQAIDGRMDVKGQGLYCFSAGSADCHCGLQDPSCCSARSALPGALHPTASAHYGLPEGRFAAHVVRALPHQDQQLPLPGGMMHPGINDQCGEDCGSFTFLLEGRREGTLTVRPCCHHLFMLSANLL